MQTTKTLSLVLSLGALAQAQTVNLTGKITSQAGKAIANAIVTLTPMGLKDTSGANGSYTLTSGNIAVLPSLGKNMHSMSFLNGVLEINLGRSASVKVEVFDTKGARLNSDVFQNTASGIYRMDFAKMALGTGICLIKVSVDQSTTTFRYAPMNGSKSGLVGSSSFTQQGTVLARVAAVTDSIKVTASGYKSKTVVATSLTSTINVSLDTILSSDRWGGLNNPPIKSTGCGKALGALPNSGTYHISTVDGRGEFIIDIPTGYDKNKPYRLVFANHCMGGSAARMAAPDTKGVETGEDLSGYYSIKTMATIDNIQNIYVAMQGDGGGTWNAPNDFKFFADVLTHVESNLCVDTTRVFVAGFSFGAMFSYALSLEYPEKIRAVATYAPANWNFYQPPNRHIPVAYYQTTGTGDGLCSWINNDAQKLGGKYCLLQHAQDNGCNTSAEIKLATSGTHVVTEFKGCKEGYPVKFSSFNGGHQAEGSDPGSNKNWIQDETWAFFKQF